MAGEGYIRYGIGYSFDAEVLRDAEGYIETYLQDEDFFDRARLVVIESFYGVPNDPISVVARSTLRSGDPQEWDHGYGVQQVSKPTEEELAAFAALHEGLRRSYPALSATASELGLILSITADI